uniref:Uncharacterized protein n=1 Tax=Kwoniella pini CBS 10737 TaxID=1296096 RepID=A0A1B9I1H3_9TREE|nr:uncharacterized protein I206_05067 [Kwoniella pini CBS 10737]OCF49374.1 hypothetical protein I206_05067 [Kwoniella pini CBS 10737]
MAPLDIGGIAETAVNGAAGAIETATKGADGVAKTAAGAVSTATNAVNNVKGQYDDAKGMLGMFTQIQGYITKIQDAWDKYQYLIIFGKYLWKNRNKKLINNYLCKICLINSNDKNKNKNEKENYHKFSKICLKFIPKKIRIELEKQHGDLRKGWFDSTYFIRQCGRIELPNEPEERIKWYWYGHENSKIHKILKFCFLPKNYKEKRLEKEFEKENKRSKYFNNLIKGEDKLGYKSSDWRDRVNRSWLKEKERDIKGSEINSYLNA